MNPIITKLAGNLAKRSPEILTGLGIAGGITTVIMAIKATPKANLIIDNAIADKGEDLTFKEKATLQVKSYWPTILMGAVSIACFVGSNIISANHYHALEAVYVVTAETLKNHQEAISETLTAKEKAKVEERIVEKTRESKPVTQTNIINTGNGKTLFFDLWSGRYFESDMETVRRGINEANKYMLDNDDLTLNDLYSCIGLPEIDSGDYCGWNSNCNGLLEIEYIPKLLDGDDRPVIAIKFDEGPTYSFYN